MKKNNILAQPLQAVLLTAMCLLGTVSCSSDSDTADTGTSGNEESATTSGRGSYFIAVKASSGTEYIMQATSLTSGNLNIKNNIMELPQTEYTWVFQNHDAIGLTYQQQYAGIGYGLRWTSDNEQLSKLGEFRVEDRYSNYGFFNSQLVTSVGGQVSSDGTRNDGATFTFWNITDEGVQLDHTKTIWTEDITGNGQQVTFSSIVDMGDGTFLSAMVESAFHQTGTGNGSSIGEVKYPDSCWVARLDKNLNIIKVYGDDRLSYAAGQYRSQVLPEVFRTDDGTVYVFSNGFNTATTRKAGALRINAGADDFDADYYWNLEAEADGYKFRRVWYLTGSKFLLEIYDEQGSALTTITAGHRYAIADMAQKKFTWVTGLPEQNLIVSGAETGGVPCYADGVIYMPITQYKQDAAIYVINPETAVATKGITLTGVYEIRTIGKLNN